jgi:hypothetical protein
MRFDDSKKSDEKRTLKTPHTPPTRSLTALGRQVPSKLAAKV